ncbi:MAG: 1-acyl-sn-glycerol-3-phosphate acyltransferase [Spirochaetales bacterium]|nr:1-acyl-sn-glycerol-3-phosphate acyltransferase [Spirochaetales bacterium]
MPATANSSGREEIRFADVIAEQAPRVARRLGRFGLWFVGVAIGQRPFGRTLRQVRGATPHEFIRAAVATLDLRIDVRGAELLPDSPEIIAVANHPTGGAEGIALLQLLLDRYGSVIVPANRLLCRLQALNPIIAPVHVFDTGPSKRRVPDALVPPGTPLLLFPAGRTARERGGVMYEFPWKRGFIRLARRSGRLIVPVCVVTRPSRLFRTIAAVRRLLHCPINIEMFLLVREVLLRRRRVTLVIERPVASDDFPHDITDAMRAEHIQKMVEVTYAEYRRRDTAPVG